MHCNLAEVSILGDSREEGQGDVRDNPLCIHRSAVSSFWALIFIQEQAMAALVMFIKQRFLRFISDLQVRPSFGFFKHNTTRF